MDETNQTARDAEHLKLLSVFHYVLGGMLYLFGCFPIIHLLMGIAILTGTVGPDNSDDEFPKLLFGVMFTILPLLFIFITWTIATLVVITGKKLSRRVSFSFCFLMCCIECVFFPFGTVLGVFGIIILNRPSVRAMFTPPPQYCPRPA